MGKFISQWTDEHTTALGKWKAYCDAAGIDINVRQAGQGVRPSEGIALLEALRFALAKTRPILPRAPGDRSPAKCVACGRDVEEGRLCYAYPTCYTCLPPPPPIPVHTAADDVPPAPTDRDRLRAAMQRAGVDAATLARTLGYGHRSAVADVLRERGPRPLQGRLREWVEKSERAVGEKTCRMPGRHDDGCQCAKGGGK